MNRIKQYTDTQIEGFRVEGLNEKVQVEYFKDIENAATPGEGNGENEDEYTPPDNDGGFGKAKP